MRESEAFKKVKAEARKLRNLHKLNPKLHEWVPMSLTGGPGPEMELGCKCGAWVWVSAEEIPRFAES